MSIFKKIFQNICPHNWVQSTEEYMDFSENVDGRINTRRIWKCSKCGKISRVRPHHKLKK